MGRSEGMSILTKFKEKFLANPKKNPIFASECEEPTALATDVGKPIPTLSGEAAIRFIENSIKVEEDVKKHMNETPSLEKLKRELTFKKFFLEEAERQAEEIKGEIIVLENRIKELETQLNGEEQEK